MGYPTLEQEFKTVPLLNEEWPGQQNNELRNYYRFVKILRYIIKNNARLETKNSLSDETWKSGTLREFLRFSTGLSSGSDPDNSGFQDYTAWWRIKRMATKSELERIIKIDDIEEF